VLAWRLVEVAVQGEDAHASRPVLDRLGQRAGGLAARHDDDARGIPVHLEAGGVLADRLETRAPGPISVWSMTIDPATIAPGAMRTPRPRIERTTRASSTVVPSPNMLSSISPERMRAGGPSAERAKIGQRGLSRSKAGAAPSWSICAS